MFYSDQLCMRVPEPQDAEFFLELLNTESFVHYIGDRQVRTHAEAVQYIATILQNEEIRYWVISLLSNGMPVGIVSIIKRDYLAFHDIGFALLPRYAGLGYAHEATQAMLEHLIDTCQDERILATVIPENQRSIQLLRRLGLRFDDVLEEPNASSKESLHIYSISRDELLINRLSKRYFSVFSNRHSNAPRFDQLTAMCLPTALFNHKTGERFTAANIEQFIRPRQQILTNGYLREFEEFEITSETLIVGNIAQRQCLYGKHGLLADRYFEQKGNKMLQFVKEAGTWKINSALWEDHAMAN